jgi:large subunit ribosomal protein L23
MKLFGVIKKPLVTEKTQRLELAGTYTMVINDRATKTDVAHAIESLYGVEVAKVNIIKTRNKFHNTSRGAQLKRRSITKALITLKDGKRIADLLKLKIKD